MRASRRFPEHMPARQGSLRKLGAGIVLGGGALGVFLAGPLPLFAFVTALYLPAYVELRRLLCPSASRVTLPLGAGAVVGCAWLGYRGRVEDLPWVVAGLVLACLVARILVVEAGLGKPEGSTQDVAGTVAAAGVVGLLGAHLFLIRSHPQWGFRGALAFGLMVLLNDALAFVVGKAVGRRPLAPRLSPGKTWEGLAAGTAATLGVGVGAGQALDPPFTAASALVLAVLVAVLAPVGDLAQSALKRAAGVKDSGSWLPAQGGALDVLDSLLVCAPAFYWAFRTLVV